MEYNEDQYLMISGLQHFSFCRRQWALIHIEQQWSENYRTVAGEILHERAHDDTFTESRKGILITRGMAVSSRSLGMSGNCDIVEFQKAKDGITLAGRDGLYEVVPIEYKRGAPKEQDSDLLQLCAQAMCLEEMLLCSISYGYIYYGETKRRFRVDLSNQLRKQVKDAAQEMHEYYRRQYTPKVKITKACNACSLKETCIPKLNKKLSAHDYIQAAINEGEKE